MKSSKEYQRFDEAMGQLLKVPHSEIKKKLDQEKAEKQQRKKSKTKKEKESN